MDKFLLYVLWCSFKLGIFPFFLSSLQVWSAEWLVHTRKWTIMSIPSVVLSAAYRPSETKYLNGVNCAESQSQLFLGDEEGFLTIITFLQPRASLFRPKDTENKKDKFFWAVCDSGFIRSCILRDRFKCMEDSPLRWNKNYVFVS